MTITVTKNNLSEVVYLLTDRILHGGQVAIDIENCPEELYLFSDEYIAGKTQEIVPMKDFITELKQHVAQKA